MSINYLALAIEENWQQYILSPQAIAVIDKDMENIIWANGEACHWLGINPLCQKMKNIKTYRQIKSVCQKIDNDNDTESDNSNIQSGFLKATTKFTTQLINFNIKKINIKNNTEAFLLTSKPTRHKGFKIKQMAQLFTDIFNHHNIGVAILDEKGKMLANLSGMETHEFSHIIENKQTQQIYYDKAKIDGRKMKIEFAKLEIENKIFYIIFTPNYSIKWQKEIIIEKQIESLQKITTNKNADVQKFSTNINKSGLTRWYYKDKKITKPKKSQKTNENNQQQIRFTWEIIEMDGEFIFTHASNELGNSLKQTIDISDKNWQQICQQFNIKNGENIEALLQTKQAWSGQTILWPIEQTNTFIPIDLAGLPNYGKHREFSGFSGFGIIRPNDSIKGDNIKTKTTTTLTHDEKLTFNKIGEELTANDKEKIKKDYLPAAFVCNEPPIAAPPLPKGVDVSILTELPIAVLIYRDNKPLFANNEFLQIVGYDSFNSLANTLQNSSGINDLFENEKNDILFHKQNGKIEVETKIQTVPWDKQNANLMTIQKK